MALHPDSKLESYGKKEMLFNAWVLCLDPLDQNLRGWGPGIFSFLQASLGSGL